MTTRKTPRICDACGKDILSEKQYKIQISMRGNKRGTFVKANNDADFCHPCFMKLCDTGYKPEWVTLQLDPDTKKWLVQEQQEKLVAK